VRFRCDLAASIDERGTGGADGVTHDNAAAEARRVATTSQVGAAGHLSLPGNWIRSGAPAWHRPATDGRAGMSSRNCSVTEERNDVRVPHFDEQTGASLGQNDEFSLVVRRSGDPTNIHVDLRATAMSDADGEIPSFRRRPLMWAASAGRDEASASPCSSEDLNFFHAWMDDEEEDDNGCQRNDEINSQPEMTSSTWISLFRTFFMGAGGQQPRAAVERPICRRLQDRDVDDLLDRTLSTITEEGADELARTLSELDDDLADAWRRERDAELDSSLCENEAGYSSEDDEDNDVNTHRFASMLSVISVYILLVVAVNKQIKVALSSQQLSRN